MPESFPRYCSRNLYNSTFSVITALVRLLLEGRLSDGDAIGQLETYLKEKYSCQSVFLTNRGRHSIYLILKAYAGQSEKQNVLLPVYICPSVPDAVTAAGFKPIFLPVGRDLSITEDRLDEKQVKNAAAILIPHIYGYPAAIERIVEIARMHNPEILVIDDAASAFGLHARGRLLGTYGDAGVLSFAQGKQLNATGGGAILLNRSDLQPCLEKLYSPLPHPEVSRKIKEALVVLWKYGWHRFSDPVSYWLGKVYNTSGNREASISKIANLDARLCLESVRGAAIVQDARSRILARYVRMLSGVPGVSIPHELNDGWPAVSRFYIAFKHCRVELDLPSCQIQQHNPLHQYLQRNGVKSYYPYLPVARYWEQYSHLWSESPWLLTLVGLPVDFKEEPAWHDHVVGLIQTFIEGRAL